MAILGAFLLFNWDAITTVDQKKDINALWWPLILVPAALLVWFCKREMTRLVSERDSPVDAEAGKAQSSGLGRGSGVGLPFPGQRLAVLRPMGANIYTKAVQWLLYLGLGIHVIGVLAFYIVVGVRLGASDGWFMVGMIGGALLFLLCMSTLIEDLHTMAGRRGVRPLRPAWYGMISVLVLVFNIGIGLGYLVAFSNVSRSFVSLDYPGVSIRGFSVPGGILSVRLTPAINTIGEAGGVHNKRFASEYEVSIRLQGEDYVHLSNLSSGHGDVSMTDTPEKIYAFNTSFQSVPIVDQETVTLPEHFGTSAFADLRFSGMVKSLHSLGGDTFKDRLSAFSAVGRIPLRPANGWQLRDVFWLDFDLPCITMLLLCMLAPATLAFAHIFTCGL